MDRMTAIAVFVETAERGSLTAAARALDMSRAMATRYLAELERWLGVRLLHRTTRRIGLTTAGESALVRLRQMHELSQDLRAGLAADNAQVQGAIRLGAPISFGVAQLGAAVADFLGRHPGARFELLMSEQRVNLVEERIDLAIRIAREIDPSLIARRFSVCRSVVVAAPAYLQARGTPRGPEELVAHNCLTHHYFGRERWQFQHAGRSLEVPVGGNISSNEATTLLAATLAGAGIALLPTYQAMPAVRSGALIALLPGHEPPVQGMYAVYASRRQMPAVVRSFLDYLGERFGEQPEWDRG